MNVHEVEEQEAIEFGVHREDLYTRQRKAYEETEREDMKDERSKGVNNTGKRKDFL